jgi:phosphoribosylformimino-5-aminoimidazole carboxamide ribonucleotide (ProFAR) isomerase
LYNSGKYDFKGIKKYGAKGLLLALTSSPYFAWVNTWGVRNVAEVILEWVVNWFANSGLMVLNITAISVEGKWDQKDFDAAMEEALKKVEISGGTLTPEQQKAIDDAVIKAFRKFAIFTK